MDIRTWPHHCTNHPENLPDSVEHDSYGVVLVDWDDEDDPENHHDWSTLWRSVINGVGDDEECG